MATVTHSITDEYKRGVELLESLRGYSGITISSAASIALRVNDGEEVRLPVTVELASRNGRVYLRNVELRLTADSGIAGR